MAFLVSGRCRRNARPWPQRPRVHFTFGPSEGTIGRRRIKHGAHRRKRSEARCGAVRASVVPRVRRKVFRYRSPKREAGMSISGSETLGFTPWTALTVVQKVSASALLVLAYAL